MGASKGATLEELRLRGLAPRALRALVLMVSAKPGIKKSFVHQKDVWYITNIPSYRFISSI